MQFIDKELQQLFAAPLFEGLDQTLLEEIKDQVILFSVKRGENLSDIVSTRGALFFVIKGTLKWNVLDVNGEWRIIKFVTPNDVINVHAMLSNKSKQERFIANNDSQLFVLKESLIDELKMKDPSFMLKLISLATKEATYIEKHANKLMSYPLKERLILAVSDWAKKFGLTEDNRINLKLSKKEIANFIAASKSSMNRLIHEMEDSQTLRIEQNQVRVIDPNILNLN